MLAWKRHASNPYGVEIQIENVCLDFFHFGVFGNVRLGYSSILHISICPNRSLRYWAIRLVSYRAIRCCYSRVSVLSSLELKTSMDESHASEHTRAEKC